MSDAFRLVESRVRPPLDPGFRPAILANRHFQKEVEESGGGVPLVISLERGEGAISRFETQVFPTEFPQLTKKLSIQLPDEKSRRVGQSIAAACLPALDGGTR